MKILVVDDHALVREGLRQVLKGLDENVEVLDAPHCARAFDLADLHPDLDLVLLDYHLPDMDGLSALETLRSRHPELPVVMLSGSVDPYIMNQVLGRGAAGFVTKSGMSEELLTALRAVLNGDIYMPALWHATPRPSLLADPNADRPNRPHFTSKQLEVLNELMAGMSNREICEKLGIGAETVKNHVTAILRAFGVQTRTQAVLAANRLGYGKLRTGPVPLAGADSGVGRLGSA
jgi:DNA-binding NarL/FixJ family response regulator